MKNKNVYGACIRKRISSHFYDRDRSPGYATQSGTVFFFEIFVKNKRNVICFPLALVQFRDLQSKKAIVKDFVAFFWFHILL